MRVINTVLRAIFSFGLSFLLVYIPSLYIETSLNLFFVAMLGFIILWVANYFIIDYRMKGWDIEESFVSIWDFTLKEIDYFACVMYGLLFVSSNIVLYLF